MDSVKHELNPGYLTTFEIQAMEIKPSEDLRSITYSRRGCRFDDEIEGLKVFQKYSQPACELDLKIISAEELCKCVPWYMPSTQLKVN